MADTDQNDRAAGSIPTETNDAPSVGSAKHFGAIAVIFEVFSVAERKQEYLDIAASLRPVLEQIDGFISVERFQSLTDPSKLLSLSFFRDEEAIQEWRNLAVHRAAQSKGRAGIFRDYHLRIAGVIRDYGMFDRDQAPNDSHACLGAVI